MDTSAQDITIAKLISNLPRLRVYDEEITAYETNNPFIPKYNVSDKATYLGIEVEVENVTRFNQTSPYWSIITDGSLRNRGQEFITPPIRAKRVEQALNTLFMDLNKDIDFSERTSIHIHMNVRTLTVEQLRSFMYIYMVFEKVLFDFVGKDRYENIFCVPLCETNSVEALFGLMNDGIFGIEWMKYTAINLLPISTKGTVEFRHMHGTNDIEKLMNWINIILCIKQYALRKEPQYIIDTILDLNTSSGYRLFGEQVFGNSIQLLYNENYTKNLESCSSFVKETCFNNEFEYIIRDNIEKESGIREFIDKNTATLPEYSSYNMTNLLQRLNPEFTLGEPVQFVREPVQFVPEDEDENEDEEFDEDREETPEEGW